MFYISAKYYQENIGRLKKRPVKDIKILLIKKKNKTTRWSQMLQKYFGR